MNLKDALALTSQMKKEKKKLSFVLSTPLNVVSERML